MTVLQTARRWAPWLVFISTLVLRLATAARFPTEWDSVQFVLGVDHFDVSQDSPHAPGYWSYIALGRLVRAVTPLDAHASLVVIAAAASAATGAFLFLAARHLGGDWLGWVAAALWATSPVAWFYGSIANTKVFDAAGLSGVLVLALRARPGGRQALWAMIAVGVASGLRQSSALLLVPLALYVLLRCCRRPAQVVAPLLAGAMAVAAWAIPAALEQPGGWQTLRAVNRFMFEIAARQTSVLYGARAEAVRENVGRTLMTTLVAVAPVLPVFVLAAIGRLREPPGNRWPARMGLLGAAVLPGLLLGALLHFATPGYALAHLPAALLVLLAPAAWLHPRLRVAATAAVILFGALGAQRFLVGNGSVPRTVMSHRWIPTSTSLAEIRRLDDGTGRHIELGSELDPSTDVLVFVEGNGYELFRAMSLFLDRYAVHLVLGRTDGISTYGRQTWFDEDAQIEVPPGGRAIVVLNHDDPALVDPGPASGDVPDLTRGPTVRAVGIGGAGAGVRVVADPGALRPKKDPAHRRPCGGGPC